MNIVYTTNEAFTAKVATGICSIFENNKNVEEINIYIIGQEISNKSSKRFSEMARKYKRKIEIISLNDIYEFFPFEFDTLGWKPIVLARLAMDKLLPSYVEKVIYLDGDTVVLGELEDLWNTSMNGSVLGGCIEATVTEKRRKQLKMENLPYINSGVLLVDLKKWRDEKWGEKIINYYRMQGGKLFAPDQDAINGALLDRITYLPPKYNFYNIYWFYPYKFFKKLMGNAYYYSKKEFSDSTNNPIIIHYLGEERPWRKGNHHPFKAEYYRYLRLTPWKDEKDEEGWKVYFVLWDIFNFIMKPFPRVRYRIIDSLIPQFMKWRKKQIKKKNDYDKGENDC